MKKWTMEMTRERALVLIHVLGDAVSDWGEPFKDFDYLLGEDEELDPYPIARKLSKELNKAIKEHA